MLVLFVITVLFYPATTCTFWTGVYSGLECNTYIPIVELFKFDLWSFMFIPFADVLFFIKIPLIIFLTLKLHEKYSEKVMKSFNCLKKYYLEYVILLLFWVLLMLMLFGINYLIDLYFPWVGFVD